MTMTSTIWHDGEDTYSGHIDNENFTTKSMDDVKTLMTAALDKYAKTK